MMTVLLGTMRVRTFKKLPNPFFGVQEITAISKIIVLIYLHFMFCWYNQKLI